MNKVSIVVPVYNEINTIDEILKKIENASFYGLEKEVILVDDMSTDGTREKLKELENKYKVFYHEKNQGKGAAIRTAMSNITGDIMVIQDADLEYDPNDYEDLIKLIVENKADVVYGSRLTGAKPSRSFMFTHLLGNKLLTFTTNLLYGATLTDMETCYKVFKREIIQSITIEENRFGFEPEITAKVAKIKSIRIYEVGISYYGRTYEEGKKIGIKDGFRALWAIMKYRFKS